MKYISKKTSAEKIELYLKLLKYAIIIQGVLILAQIFIMWIVYFSH